MSENRHTEGKTPAARLVLSMKDDGVNMSRWNEDTITRYIAVGRRLQAETVRAKLMLWEAFEFRNCLVDNMTVMRCIVGVCQTDDDLEYVLQVLFLEQRAGMRDDAVIKKTSHNENRTPTNRMKAILLRRSLLIHLSQQFPRFSDVVAMYDTAVYVKTAFNIDSDGTRPIDYEEPEDDAEPQGDDADDAELGLSSHLSRAPLQRLLRKLASNDMERILCCMAKESASSKASVDLTVPAAKPLVEKITEIASLLDSHH